MDQEEAPLVGEFIRRKQVWRQAFTVAQRLGRDPSEANGLETVWRDAATPTRAEQADAAVKMVQAGVIDQEQVQEDAGT